MWHIPGWCWHFPFHHWQGERVGTVGCSEKVGNLRIQISTGDMWGHPWPTADDGTVSQNHNFSMLLNDVRSWAQFGYHYYCYHYHNNNVITMLLFVVVVVVVVVEVEDISLTKILFQVHGGKTIVHIVTNSCIKWTILYGEHSGIGDDERLKTKHEFPKPCLYE